MPMEPWAVTKKVFITSDTSSCSIPYSKASCPKFHVGYVGNFSDHPRRSNLGLLNASQ